MEDLEKSLQQKKTETENADKPARKRLEPTTGPSLPVTMRFVQDMMNNQGTVGYVWRDSNATFELRYYYQISDVTADPTKCTIQKTETLQIQTSPDPGVTYMEHGKAVSGAELSSRFIEASTLSLGTVVSVKVEANADQIKRERTELGRPEWTVVITPAVYVVRLIASRSDAFTFHTNYTHGTHAPDVEDYSSNKRSVDVPRRGDRKATRESADPCRSVVRWRKEDRALLIWGPQRRQKVLRDLCNARPLECSILHLNTGKMNSGISGAIIWGRHARALSARLHCPHWVRRPKIASQGSAYTGCAVVGVFPLLICSIETA